MTETDAIHIGQSLRHRLWTVQGFGLSALAFLNFFPPVHGPTRYLFFCLLIVAAMTLWRQGGPLWTRTPIDAPLLLFVGWILVTVPFSIDPAYSFREWRKLGAQVLLLYWVITVLRNNEGRRVPTHVLLAVMAGAGVTAGYALVEFLLQGGTWRGRDVRAGAMGSDYNWLSTYMVIAMPMLVAATVLSRPRWLKVLGIGTTGLACLAEAAAYTRAGWLGLVAEAVAGLWLAGRRWLLMGLVALLIAGGIGVAVTVSVDDPVETSAVGDPWTFKARLNVWRLAAVDLLEHPVVGVGYGNYNFVKRYAGRPELEKAHGPHSTFVVIGLGSGLPALGLFLWLLARIFRTLTSPFRHARPAREGEGYMIPFGGALMVVGFAVRNAFDYMLIGGLANLFWILVAVALSAVQAPDRRDNPSSEPSEDRSPIGAPDLLDAGVPRGLTER